MLALTGCAARDHSAADSLPADVRVLTDDGYHGALLAEPYDVSEQALRDTTGAPYSLVASTNKPLTLVFFGYTNCPDICSIVMSSLAAALTSLEPNQRGQVAVVLVTTDPARDDESVLRKYLDRLNPAFIGLTGSSAEIRTVAASLRVFVEKGRPLPSGGYEVEHGTPVIGIDHTDRAPIVWTQGTSARQFSDDIETLLRAAAGK
ncbi:MAG: SCO family protein, partial [Nocardioides sp.]